jgi:hypothetical protein
MLPMTSRETLPLTSGIDPYFTPLSPSTMSVPRDEPA